MILLLSSGDLTPGKAGIMLVYSGYSIPMYNTIVHEKSTRSSIVGPTIRNPPAILLPSNTWAPERSMLVVKVGYWPGDYSRSCCYCGEDAVFHPKSGELRPPSPYKFSSPSNFLLSSSSFPQTLPSERTNHHHHHDQSSLAASNVSRSVIVLRYN